jgi:hypothetical protein
MCRLYIVVLTTRCPILRNYIGATGEVGSDVAVDKDYTGGAVQDARFTGGSTVWVARRGAVVGSKARAYGTARFARRAGGYAGTRFPG